MTTIQEGQFYDALPRVAHALSGIEDSLRSIDGHLNRIANLSEADELRRRGRSQEARGWAPIGTVVASVPDEELLDFAKQVLAALPDEVTTPEQIAEMGKAVQAVRRGFADLERQVREEGDHNE